MLNKSIFITVRMGSTRLPNKALKKIGDKTSIEFLINRLRYSSFFDNIVLCTTNLSRDDVLVEIARKNKIDYYRGSEEDKLLRWLGAVNKYKVEFFVTADGDDSFCEPYLIDLAFKQYKRNKSDYIQSTGIICGAFTNGISSNAIKQVCEVKDTSDTEMIWPYFTDTGLFKVEELEEVPKKF
jgi:Spore coat polysaccharide biosynthesis protein F, CMP-KDO synthetase homolog